MLVPLIGLILGLTVIFYAFLAYTGSSLLQPMPTVFKQRDNWFWTAGCVLVALALMLGIFGYLSHWNPYLLRLLRIAIGSVGLLVLGSQVLIRYSR